MTATAFAPLRVVLDNGLTLLHQHNPVSPAVTISLSFAGGSAVDPPGKEGTATLMARGLTRGTQDRTKTQIGAVLDDRGAHLAGTAGRHSAGLVAKARDADFTMLLDLAFECARTPTFPDDEVRKLRGDRLTSLREDEDDPAAVVGRFFRELAYPPEHPYGRPHRGLPETVANVEAADLRAHHAQTFAPGRGLLIVVGGVDRERTVEAVRRATESWPGTPGTPGFRSSLPTIGDVPALQGVRESRVVMADKLQSDVALGFPAIRRSDPRFHAAVLMNSVLGQFAMGGRLGRSVREEQGMAYYTYSALDPSLGPGAFRVRAGVAAANVDRAVDSIRAEIRRMRSEPVQLDELEDARAATVRSLPRTLESNEGMAGLLHRIETHDLGLDYLERFEAAFQEVTVDAVHEAAREILDADAYALAVAGPEPGPAD